MTGHQEGSRGLTSPSRHAHLRRYGTVAVIRRCLRRNVRGGSGPKESRPLQPGRPSPRNGTDDNRTATALGDVAWAAAVFPSDPPGRRWGLPMSHCCAVMIQSPLLKGRVHACACGQKDHLRTPRWPAPHRKSRPAAQRTGGHRRVATRKTTGDLAT